MKKTEYALITQQQFDDMRAAIQEYQQQHKQLRADQSPVCPCNACRYAERARVTTSQTYAPIFIASDIPWHEE